MKQGMGIFNAPNFMPPFLLGKPEITIKLLSLASVCEMKRNHGVSVTSFLIS